MREYAGGRPSQSSVARRPSPCTPTLLGTEVILRCCVCCVVDFCLYAAVLKMERCADLVSVFFGTYGGTLCRSAICSLYSSIFMMVRCADLVPVFFDIYGDTLGRSSSCILRYLWWYAGPIPFLYSSILIGIFCTSLTFQDRTPSPLPSPACFFLSVGIVSQRKVTSGRAAAEEGWLLLGLRETALLRQGLLSEPKASSGPAAMLLAVSRSPSSIPRRSPCPERCHLSLASLNHIHLSKSQKASPTASTPGAMPPSSGVPLYIRLTSPQALPGPAP